MSLPEFNFDGDRGPISGMGDEVEQILFTSRMLALSKLIADPTREVQDVMRESLESMLATARENGDKEYSQKFENALARLPRFCE